MKIPSHRLVLGALASLALTAAASAATPHEIRLLDRAWTPSPGITEADSNAITARAETLAAAGQERIHVLLQLHTVPDNASRQALRLAGIELGPYASGTAWIASLPVDAVATALGRDEVRWATPWDASFKLHPRVRTGDWAPWTRDDRAPGWVMTFVQLHHDVDLATGPALAERHGGVTLPAVQGLHGMTVWLPETRVAGLADEESVLWVEEGPPPLSPNNDGARDALVVDTVAMAPYNLDGTGVRLFVFDAGTVRSTHTTFDPGTGGRVTVIDGQGSSNHPTHVAGTAAGDGNNGRPQGVAPGTTVLSAGFSPTGGTMFFWDNAGDIEADYGLGRNTHDADLINNSIGSNTASNGFPCDREGDYGLTSNLLDAIIRDDNGTVTDPVIVVWANGNERTGGSPRGRCGSNYVTTAPPACAKNPIHVGALNSDGGSVTSFSSWGPCDDGRLKPTISGPGCESGRVTGESFIFSSLNGSDNQFGGSGWCGTSMSSPAVAGVVALLIEDWRAQGHGTAFDRPLPGLVRAMLAHTARDHGPDGPDFVYGYGHVDAKALIDHMRAGDGTLGDLPTNWGTGDVTDGATDNFTVTVPAGQGTLVATLAWDDAAAAAFAANALVNDLTLELVAPDTTVHQAWVLDAGNPHLHATRGANVLDNIEQVVVENPAAGTWTVRVAGTSVPTGPQTYGLAWNVAPSIGACTTTNWGFEGGLDSFVLSGASARTASPAAGHGAFSLQLGGGTSQTDEAYREITVPAGVSHAEATLWWHMTTAEGVSGHGFDNFLVEIRSNTGTVLSVVDIRSDGWTQDEWLQQQNIDLTEYANQTIRLAFRATNSAARATTFWADDVTFTSCTDAIFFDGFESGDTTVWSVTVP